MFGNHLEETGTIMIELFEGNKTAGVTGEGKPGSERGAVLIVVVVLSAIALLVATSLLYMITSSTKISGMEKRYRTAREANYGAVAVLGQMIYTIQTKTTDAWLASYNLQYVASGCPLSTKITTDSTTWAGACLASTPDFSFDIGSSPVYRVYVRIVDGKSGNTLGSYAGQEVGSHIDTHQGVVSTQTELPVESIPYSYIVETDTRNLSKPTERSRLQIFYQY